MSTHNISFHWEIRKISAVFWWKKCLICCYDWGASYEYPEHMFSRRNKKNIHLNTPLTLSCDEIKKKKSIYHNDIKLEGDFVELSLDVECFLTSLLHVIGPLVIGVSPVCPKLPVNGVKPVWSTIVSKLKLKNPLEGVVIETPAEVMSGFKPLLIRGRLDGRDVDISFLKSCGTGDALETFGSSLTLTPVASVTITLGALTFASAITPLTLQRGLWACNINSRLSFSFCSICISDSIEDCSFSSFSVSCKSTRTLIIVYACKPWH